MGSRIFRGGRYFVARETKEVSEPSFFDDVDVEIKERNGRFAFVIELAPGNPGVYSFDSGYIFKTHAAAQLAGISALDALERDAGEH